MVSTAPRGAGRSRARISRSAMASPSFVFLCPASPNLAAGAATASATMNSAGCRSSSGAASDDELFVSPPRGPCRAGPPSSQTISPTGNQRARGNLADSGCSSEPARHRANRRCPTSTTTSARHSTETEMFFDSVARDRFDLDDAGFRICQRAAREARGHSQRLRQLPARGVGRSRRACSAKAPC